MTTATRIPKGVLCPNCHQLTISIQKLIPLVEKLYLQGSSQKEIADLLGVTQSWVSKLLKKAGVPQQIPWNKKVKQ